MVISHDTYALANMINNDIYRMSDIWRYSGRLIHKPENLAEHSFYVAFRIYDLGAKYGVDEARIAKAVKIALCHDCGEIYTGDLPHCLKVYSPEIRRVSEQLEIDLIGEHFPNFGKDFKEYAEKTDPIVSALVEASDCLDVVMFINREEELGNRNQDILDIRAEVYERYIRIVDKLTNLVKEEIKHE